MDNLKLIRGDIERIKAGNARLCGDGWNCYNEVAV